jgi:hypothetical protein
MKKRRKKLKETENKGKEDSKLSQMKKLSIVLRIYRSLISPH